MGNESRFGGLRPLHRLPSLLREPEPQADLHGPCSRQGRHHRLESTRNSNDCNRPVATAPASVRRESPAQEIEHLLAGILPAKVATSAVVAGVGRHHQQCSTTGTTSAASSSTRCARRRPSRSKQPKRGSPTVQVGVGTGRSNWIPPQRRWSMLIRGSGVWNPKARRAIIRSLLLKPSTMPLVSRSSK